jgi:hypothetical protein
VIGIVLAILFAAVGIGLLYARISAGAPGDAGSPPVADTHPLPGAGPLVTYPAPQEAAHPYPAVPARPDTTGWSAPAIGPILDASAAAIYDGGADEVVAHEPAGGHVSWQAGVSLSVTDIAVAGHALLVSGTPNYPSMVTDLLDSSTGQLLQQLDGQPVATNQDGSIVVLADDNAVQGVSTTTGRPVWSVIRQEHEVFVGGPSWYGLLNSQTGEVRPLDPTNRDAHGFVVPAAAQPDGFTLSGWIVEGADSSVYVSTDVSNQTIVVSGINPTTGAGLWSRRLRIVALSAATPVAVSGCGPRVCLTDGGGVAVVDPKTGAMTVLTGATKVFTNGKVWAAQYEVPAAGTSVIDAVAYLDPNRLAPGPATEYLTPVGFVGDDIAGLRYLSGTNPAQDAASGTDTAVITLTPQGDQSPRARLAGTHWTCAPAALRLACVSSNPAILRVVPALGL